MTSMTMSQQTAITRRKPLAIFSSDPRFRAEATSRLNALAVYDVIEGDEAGFLAGRIAEGTPRLIILDVHDGSMLSNPRLATAKDAWGEVPIIAVSAELSPEKVRDLVRLGSVDWLTKPVDGKELVNSVVHNDGISQVPDSQVITFIAASGGAGATTLALSAAGHLGEEAKTPDDTCLVDLDFQTASCAAYLNLANEFDLESVVSHPERLDIELLDVIKVQREPGLTLFSFERPDMPFSKNGRDFVLRLLDLVAFRYKDVVIDLPNLAAPWFDDVLRNSNRIYVVCEFNIPSLRQARRILKRVRELRGNTDAVYIIANKQTRKFFGQPITPKDAQKIFTNKAVRTITRDDDLMTEALNRAALPNEVAKSARTVKEMRKLFEETIDRDAAK